MSIGRPCKICSDTNKMKLAVAMIAEGASDYAVAARLGDGINRMAVSRHRTNHVVAPAKALAEAAGKGRDAIEQRAQVMAAAEAGDPSAFVALSGIVADLRMVHERLERTATAAETDNQRLAVASLSAQQLRAAEVRARIGGVGAYAPQKALGGAAGGVPQFNLVLQFSGGREERISGAAVMPGDLPETIDGFATTPDAIAPQDVAQAAPRRPWWQVGNPPVTAIPAPPVGAEEEADVDEEV